MKDVITERMPLGDLNGGMADAVAEQMGKKPSEVEFIRKGVIVKADTEEEERSSTELINTPNVDRDKEILIPRGADLTYYKQNPQVLWAHSYSTPPIGKAAWVKKKPEGLLAKTIYATTELAEEIWQLVKGGFLPARSVGFIPMESHEPDEKEIRKYPERADARRVIDKWELLEYSVVPVPSNREALQQAMAKGLNLSVDTQEWLGVDEYEEIPATPDLEEGGFVAPGSMVKVFQRIEDTGRYIRDTGRRVKVVQMGKNSLDTEDIDAMVALELRRKRGRIT